MNKPELHLCEFEMKKGVEQTEICIGLCIYNSSFGLQYVIPNLIKISNCFKKTNIIFYYDTSSDNTLEIVENWKKTIETTETETEEPTSNKINIHIIQNTDKRVKLKIINISKGRNEILRHIREHHSNCPYFIMMDANEYACIGNINISLLKEIFSKDAISRWDSISFNREAGYYDYWALSFDEYIYSFFHFTQNQIMVQSMRNDFAKKMLRHQNTGELMYVYSAFNGFAIYKTPLFINSAYDTKIHMELFPQDILQIQNNKFHSRCQIISILENDCEHRCFHLTARKQHPDIRICISPKYMFFKKHDIPQNLRGSA